VSARCCRRTTRPPRSCCSRPTCTLPLPCRRGRRRNAAVRGSTDPSRCCLAAAAVDVRVRGVVPQQQLRAVRVVVRVVSLPVAAVACSPAAAASGAGLLHDVDDAHRPPHALLLVRLARLLHGAVRCPHDTEGQLRDHERAQVDVAREQEGDERRDAPRVKHGVHGARPPLGRDQHERLKQTRPDVVKARLAVVGVASECAARVDGHHAVPAAQRVGGRPIVFPR